MTFLNRSAFPIVTLVSIIIELLPFVMVVNNCLEAAPETVMVLFEMEPQATVGVFVRVGVGTNVGTSVSVGVGVGVDVGVNVPTGIGVDTTEVGV